MAGGLYIAGAPIAAKCSAAPIGFHRNGKPIWPIAGAGFPLDGGTSLSIAAYGSGGVLYGNGADGVVDFDGVTNYAAFSSRVGSVYTLTRDLYATNITVRAGVRVQVDGFRIFAQGILVIEATGSIDSNGGDGGAPTAGVAQSSTNNYLQPASNGGAGKTTSAAGTGSAVKAVAFGGRGGTGGASNLNGGGVSGTVTVPVANQGGLGAAQNVITAILNRCIGQALGDTIAFQSATGGGGGGNNIGTGTSTSGGGGGGGGIVLIVARQITNLGTISANGGRGGDATNQTGTGNGGGGGGGGGGLVILVCRNLVGNAPVAAGGGVGIGAGVGGVNGAAGDAGRTYLLATAGL